MKAEKILTGNYRRAFIAVCVICIAVIMLLIPAARRRREYAYPIDRMIVSANDGTVLYGPIELPVGIYSVQVDYQTAADLEYVISLSDDGLPPLKVMQNMLVLAAAHSSQKFHLWLLGRSENLTLSVSGASEQEIYFEQIRIVETGQLWYCIIFGVLMLGILVLGCIVCAAWHHVHKIPVSDFVVGG